jgi:hypothetical protein
MPWQFDTKCYAQLWVSIEGGLTLQIDPHRVGGEPERVRQIREDGRLGNGAFRCSTQLSHFEIFDREILVKSRILEEVATLPATPRHTMFPLWLLPSGSDQVHG